MYSLSGASRRAPSLAPSLLPRLLPEVAQDIVLYSTPVRVWTPNYGPVLPNTLAMIKSRSYSSTPSHLVKVSSNNPLISPSSKTSNEDRSKAPPSTKWIKKLSQNKDQDSNNKRYANEEKTKGFLKQREPRGEIPQSGDENERRLIIVNEESRILYKYEIYIFS